MHLHRDNRASCVRGLRIHSDFRNAAPDPVTLSPSAMWPHAEDLSTSRAWLLTVFLLPFDTWDRERIVIGCCWDPGMGSALIDQPGRLEGRG